MRILSISAMLLTCMALTSCASTAGSYYGPGLTIQPIPESMSSEPDYTPQLACGTAHHDTQCFWY